MKLPAQRPPVRRRDGPGEPRQGRERAGITPSQSTCDGLTGLAQQMCFAVNYGVF